MVASSLARETSQFAEQQMHVDNRKVSFVRMAVVDSNAQLLKDSIVAAS